MGILNLRAYIAQEREYQVLSGLFIYENCKIMCLGLLSSKRNIMPYTVTKQFFLGVSVAQFLEWWPCNPRVSGSKLSNCIRKLFVHHDFHCNFPFT